MNYDIHKSGGIIIKDRKLLITRAKGKDFFIAPGGKLEEGETALEALKRELLEELSISFEDENAIVFDTFYAPMLSDTSKTVRMDVFTINKYSGAIKISSEIEELKWVNSEWLKGLKSPSIFDEYVIPKLKQVGLID